MTQKKKTAKKPIKKAKSSVTKETLLYRKYWKSVLQMYEAKAPDTKSLDDFISQMDILFLYHAKIPQSWQSGVWDS